MCQLVERVRAHLPCAISHGISRGVLRIMLRPRMVRVARIRHLRMSHVVHHAMSRGTGWGAAGGGNVVDNAYLAPYSLS